MKNFTYDHLVGHEVGHALYTDADEWASAIKKHGKNFRGFLNIVEDARIEKKIQRTYPGLKRSFIQSYKKMLSEGFSVEMKQKSILSNLLIESMFTSSAVCQLVQNLLMTKRSG